MNNFTDEQKEIMLDIARDSIINGLKSGAPIKPNIEDYDEILQTPFATFVTLNKISNNINSKTNSNEQQLRGCIGSLVATNPLVTDIAANACSSAFRDPRFPELTEPELNLLEIDISILTKPEDLPYANKNDLLNKIRPNIDGLILTYGVYRGTFLPTVWEQLPRKEEFLEHLVRKAGLAPGFWSDDIKIERYETICFGDKF